MKFKTLTAAALMTVAAAAQAASISAPSATFAGTVIDFNDRDGYLLPQVEAGELVTRLNVGSGVNFTATAYAVVGESVANLGFNGAWTVIGDANRDGNFVSSSFEDGSGDFRFTFASGMQQVGIFANQVQYTAAPTNSMLVSAYDRNGNVLEEQTVTIDTAFDGYDEGRFVGFTRASADIYSFSLSSGTLVVDNLTISAVPEPETFAMLLAGLVAVGAAARRRRA